MTEAIKEKARAFTTKQLVGLVLAIVVFVVSYSIPGNELLTHGESRRSAFCCPPCACGSAGPWQRASSAFWLVWLCSCRVSFPSSARRFQAIRLLRRGSSWACIA